MDTGGGLQQQLYWKKNLAKIIIILVSVFVCSEQDKRGAGMDFIISLETPFTNSGWGHDYLGTVFV